MSKQQQTLSKIPQESSETEVEKMAQERVIISWKAREYVRQERGVRWYLIAGLFAFLLLFYGLMSGNFTMIAAIVVFCVVYEYLHYYHPPKIIEIKITTMGISVGPVFYDYGSVQAFWFNLNPGVRTLHLHISHKAYSDIALQLEDQDLEPIRKYLISQIPEWEGKQEKLSEVIFRLLKL